MSANTPPFKKPTSSNDQTFTLDIEKMMSDLMDEGDDDRQLPAVTATPSIAQLTGQSHTVGYQDTRRLTPYPKFNNSQPGRASSERGSTHPRHLEASNFQAQQSTQSAALGQFPVPTHLPPYLHQHITFQPSITHYQVPHPEPFRDNRQQPVNAQSPQVLGRQAHPGYVNQAQPTAPQTTSLFPSRNPHPTNGTQIYHPQLNGIRK